MAGIVSWGSYVPRYRIKVEEIAPVWGGDPSKIASALMVHQKAVPGVDEDTATISVEASRKALAASTVDPKDINAIYIGSESHPYAVKPTGTIVGQALGVSNNYTTADLEFACKAGTAGIQVALAMVKAGMATYALAGGADTAQAAPGDPLEYTAGAGGAVFIIGNGKVVAEINHTLSFTSDTPDFWRRSHEKYPAHGGPFTGEPAYFRHVITATKNLMEEVGTNPEDYHHVILHQPNGKFPTRAGAKLGFSREQLKHGLLVPGIGNAYAGSSMLGLANVLDIARPGERILLVSYGSGAGSDAFDLTITENITTVQKAGIPLRAQLTNPIQLTYPRYLKHTKTLRHE